MSDEIKAKAAPKKAKPEAKKAKPETKTVAAQPKPYAVIEIGSKQFKASIGDIFDVDFLNANVGDTLEFKVLFKSESSIFSTAVTTAKAEVLAHGKDKKITVFKYKPKKNIRKKQGHRQHITKIKIISF